MLQQRGRSSFEARKSAHLRMTGRELAEDKVLGLRNPDLPNQPLTSSPAPTI